MNKAEKELKDHKKRVKRIHDAMLPLVRELAYNKATNPTNETNEKYALLEDHIYDLLFLT